LVTEGKANQASALKELEQEIIIIEKRISEIDIDSEFIKYVLIRYKNVLISLSMTAKDEIILAEDAHIIVRTRDSLKAECEKIKMSILKEISELKKDGRSTSRLEVLLASVREQEAKLDRVGQSDSETDITLIQMVQI